MEKATFLKPRLSAAIAFVLVPYPRQLPCCHHCGLHLKGAWKGTNDVLSLYQEIQKTGKYHAQH